MNDKKKISIAMTTYNGALYLSELMDSLCNQTIVPDEIVVVDDRSVDDTVKIIQEYATRNICIRLYQNAENLGVNLNFQKAVSLCEGDFVLICDQDDVWMPNNVEMKVKELSKFDLDKPALVACAAVSVDESLKPLDNSLKGKKKNSSNPYEIFFCPLQGANLAMNRSLVSLLKNWPKSFKEFPYDGYIRFCAFLTAEMFLYGTPLMYYRHHSNNVIGTKQSVALPKSFWRRNIDLAPKRLSQLEWCASNLPSNIVCDKRLSNMRRLSRCLDVASGFWGGVSCLFMCFISWTTRMKILLVKSHMLFLGEK